MGEIAPGSGKGLMGRGIKYADNRIVCFEYGLPESRE